MAVYMKDDVISTEPYIAPFCLTSGHRFFQSTTPYWIVQRSTRPQTPLVEQRGQMGFE